MTFSWVRRYFFFHVVGSVCVALAGTLLVTGMPVIDASSPDIYEQTTLREIQYLQFSAISSAVCSSLLTACLIQPEPPIGESKSWYLFGMAIVLLLNHALWVQPLWGFHHTASIGMFAWLIIDGEEGLSVFPNILGLPLTLLTYWIFIRLGQTLSAKEPDIPNNR